jgi:hypothetical protein
LDISRLTYARVAAGETPKRPALQPADPGVAAFLVDHVNALIEMTERADATPPGKFTQSDATALFRNLHTGTDQQFVESAHELTTRLAARMNGTTAEGLLICLRVEPGPRGSIAGALKLHIDAPHAAILKALESGEVVLTAVKDMLEKPGDLQKGALVASWLPDGQVLCGDRLSQAARYFPEAFDIRIFSRPSAATKAFFDAVDTYAGDLAARVAEVWPTLRSGPLRQVLSELSGKIPEFTTQLQAEVAEALEAAPRPIARLDTTRRVTETYQAGEIRMSGPIAAMRQHVRIHEMTEGGWQIVINSAQRPVPEHH